MLTPILNSWTASAAEFLKHNIISHKSALIIGDTNKYVIILSISLIETVTLLLLTYTLTFTIES